MGPDFQKSEKMGPSFGSQNGTSFWAPNLVPYEKLNRAKKWGPVLGPKNGPFFGTHFGVNFWPDGPNSGTHFVVIAGPTGMLFLSVANK